MPANPRKCCTKKIILKKIIDSQKCQLAQASRRTCGQSISAASNKPRQKPKTLPPPSRSGNERPRNKYRVPGYRPARSPNESAEAADREQEQKPDREQHWGLKARRALPHRGYPVEHLHTGWNRDQHGRIHEESWPVTGRPVVNM